MVHRDEVVHVIPDMLICPICMEILQDPVFFGGNPCQHVFCRECIRNALERKRECPMCRAAIGPQLTLPHHAIRSFIDGMCVRCEHACGWTGRYDARPHHAQVCPIVLLNQNKRDCMELRKTVYNLQRQIASHVEVITTQAGVIEQRDETIFRLNKQHAQQIREQHQEMINLQNHLAELRGSLHFPIFVKGSLIKKTMTFVIDHADFIQDLIRKICDFTNLHPNAFYCHKFCCRSQTLDPGLPLVQNGIGRDDTIRIEVVPP